jgi:pyridoxamine 5'-phosphate oxidase
MKVSDLRQEYMRAGLSETDADPDPLRQFDIWLREAVQAGLSLPNAMTLTTADAAGNPDARIVLL